MINSDDNAGVLSSYDNALRLAALGFYVFPLVGDSKLPAVEAFPQRATRDPEIIKAMFTDSIFGEPLNRNVGIYCGRFGDDPAVSLVVLDEDNKDGRDGSATIAKLDMLYGLPPTYTQFTPTGGKHHVYTTRAPCANSVQKLGPGVDTRGIGGFIVASGSEVPKGIYTDNGLPVAEVPDALLTHLPKHRERSAAELSEVALANIDQDAAMARFSEWLKTAPRSVKGDGGDACAYKVACAGYDEGLTAANTLHCMLGPEWDDGCGWTSDNLSRKVVHAYKYAKGVAGIKAPEMHAFEAVEVPETGGSGVSRAGAGAGALTILHPHVSESSLAEAFTESYRGKLRYCALRATWFLWDGRRFCVDTTLCATDLVRNFCKVIGERVRAAMVANDSKAEDANRAAAGFGLAKRIEAVARLARGIRGVAVGPDEFDRDPFKLNTQSGIVDLTTGKIEPHDPAANCSKVTAAAVGGTCPRWRQLIEEVTGGDHEYAWYLQKMFGYAATGSVQTHEFFFAYGRGGTGKGSVFETVADALGDYASSADFSVFAAGAENAHPTGLAALQGRRLVLVPETEQGSRWAESRIKAVTAGDRISVRYMRGDFFEMRPQCKLVFIGNFKPHIRNVEEGLRRRLRLLPFEYQPAVEDKNLRETLKGEAAGILGWIIEGAAAWKAEGLSMPRVVRVATEEYFESEDEIGQWLAACTEPAPTAEPYEFRPLWESFKQWIGEQGGYLGSQKRLSEDLKRRGLKNVKDPITRRSMFIGLRLRDLQPSHGFCAVTAP